VTTLALQVLGWMAVAYVFTSALEYFPHRFVMHSRQLARLLRMPGLGQEFEAHAGLHHGRFFRPGSFSSCRDPAARYVSIDTGVLYMLGVTWWMWLPLGLVSIVGAAVLVVFFAAHGALWTVVHREMHYPRNDWISRTAAYRFWHRYHEMHHERAGTNFNGLCPLFDQLLGTYGGLA
jgi:fatty acid hydroxylase family protein